MSFRGQVAAIYNREVNSANVALKRWPNAAAGVSVTSGAKVFGSWTTLIAAAKIDDPSWICAVIPSAPTAPTANEEYAVDLATGAAASEVSLSSGSITAQGLAGFGLNFTSVTAAGELAYPIPPINLPVPIKVTGAPRISAAVAEWLVGSTSVFLAFVTAKGLGT